MSSLFLQSVVGILIIISSLQGVAEVRALNPYVESVVLEDEAVEISIDRIAIVDSPSKIKIHHCDELANCSPTEVLESQSTVEVSFHYITKNSYREDGGLIYSSVRFPPTFFSEAELKEIAQKSNYFLDPFGLQGSELKRLARQLISYDIQSTMQEAVTLNKNQTGCSYMMAHSEFFDDYTCNEPKHVPTKVGAEKLFFKRASAQ